MDEDGVTDVAAGEAGNAGMTLRTLRPTYDEEHHKYYVDLIQHSLASESPPRNVAVAGAYGTGKSSVLTGLCQVLGAHRRVMVISLATLNQSRESLRLSTGEDTLPAALQKEVVKRLLYSAKPGKVPDSRFHRIRGFGWGRAVLRALVISAALVATAYALELPLSPATVAKESGWSWWLVALLIWVVGACFLLVLFRTFSSMRVRQLSVGPAALTLEDSGGNYFDAYLDEIIYFFQRTKTGVVLFEDLDRFDDLGIFLALRELNNLLNSAEQVQQEVVFIYAVRDSLFEDRSGRSDPSIGEIASESPAAELRQPRTESAASDRAKFFDLIVPIVPFISRDVAADLILNSFGGLPTSRRPSRQIVEIAGQYLTDMRVVHSVRNEFSIFATELLDKSKVQGLTADALLAMILFKHECPGDFERIRIGQSQLDRLVSSVSEMVQEISRRLEVQIAVLQDRIRADTVSEERVLKAGKRLEETLLLYTGVLNPGMQLRSVVTGRASKDFTIVELASREFWEALKDAGPDGLVLRFASSHQIPIAGDQLFAILGDDNPAAGWLDHVDPQVSVELEKLVALRRRLIAASLAERVSDPAFGLAVQTSDFTADIGELARNTVGSGLIWELVRAGYIDQNFALYTTKFYGDILSADARTYLLLNVDRHRGDAQFKLSGSDVEQIIKQTHGAVLRDPSVFNIAIFDQLLASDQLGDARATLLSNLQHDGADFLDTYLVGGSSADKLVREIAPHLPDVVERIASSPRISEQARLVLMGAALGELAVDVVYSISDDTRALLEECLDDLPVLHSDFGGARADALAVFLAGNRLSVGSLQRVSPTLHAALIDHAALAINRGNLQIAVGDGSGIGVDTLLDVGRDLAERAVVEVSDYVDALKEKPTAVSLDRASRVEEVLAFICEANESGLGLIIDQFPPLVVCPSLDALPDHVFGVLARTFRFEPSVRNVARYLEWGRGVDQDLERFLERQDYLTDAEESDEETRQRVALEIINAPGVSVEKRLSLATSVHNDSFLPPDRLILDDGRLLAGLLEAGLVEDSVGTFTAFAEADWAAVEPALVASSEAAHFIQDIPFTDANLVALFESAVVPSDVKSAACEGLDGFRAQMGPDGATVAMRYARKSGAHLSSQHLQLLASRGAEAGEVVEYLRHATGLEPPEMLAVLGSLEPPFSSLVSADASEVELPYSEDLRAVVDLLRDHGLVKGARKVPSKEILRVTLR